MVINHLCEGLEQLGYNASIGAFSFDSEPPSNIHKVKLTLGALMSKDMKSFDIIHSHQPRMNYYSLVSSTPFIFHWHGASSRIQEINTRVSLYLSKRKLANIISISHSALYDLKRITGNIDSEVIYNGVDTKLLNSDLARPYNVGFPELLFVGNFYPHKNISMLISGMKNILSKYPSAHLQIVGDGADRDKLSRQVIDEGLTDHIELTGGVSVKELRLRYSSCDLYISASRWEMFGLPLLEAMACGKPVLVSDIPSHREIVKLSNAGLLFSFSEENKLGDHVSTICNNLEHLSKSARKFAEMNDWSKVCQRVASIYEKVLQSE